jgi:carbamoyl-phosphate synthase small subunit
MGEIAKLVLEDGSIYSGFSLGAAGETSGEVCFNTSMTGYQEILTDPSYRGQIVAMTYPEIGNYGVNAEDMESERPHLAGFIVRAESRIVSNYRADASLSEFLTRHGVVGISGIDTRALVRRIRSQGAMRGIISTVDLNDQSLIRKANQSPGLVGRDLVQEVMPSLAAVWQKTLHPLSTFGPQEPVANDAPHIVCLDFGMKHNIARHLASRGNRVTVLPGNSNYEAVMAAKPDGIFLSNGPGDPEPLTYAIETIRKLLPCKPVFGICLGHQLLSLACGAKTFKMKFGHRGANQPVLHLESGKVEVTTQNHGFAVEEPSLPDCLEITHRNLNDQTIAGVRHREFPAFSVQYHPEASSGPHDSSYLFDQFQKSITCTIGT